MSDDKIEFSSDCLFCDKETIYKATFNNGVIKMTKRQEKLVENFIRSEVRKSLNEETDSVQFSKLRRSLKDSLTYLSYFSDDESLNLQKSIETFMDIKRM
jgi:hypothetical protein